jgi:predicted ATP-dependent endonuclease of OLD family
LIEFLRRRLQNLFKVRLYVLDPDACRDPGYGLAHPQTLIPGSEPIDGNPLKGLIRIDKINAQRGFGGSEENAGNLDDDDSGSVAASGTRKLSEQLRRYYNRHLDPDKNPDAQDLRALKAIEDAQKAFDGRLKDGFEAALKEMEGLGYPGVTDPKLKISTRLSPVEGLDHKAAVQYAISMGDGDSAVDLHLPEDSNGLGYQNLISMVFLLMSFRDAWMRVGKANTKALALTEAFTPPLHLVLIEEPEAHLHTQVQQVFIRQAYKLLRAHKDLGDKSVLTTQLVVSTHSSHLAHECEFASLRYFRRLPATKGDIPTSCVVNLTNIFGNDVDTERFVTRYLKVTHCDLFFADAAVLIEGPAERILVPHFVRQLVEFSDLSECYITWLEIGGSHAHRLRNLIEHLGLTTLIITDLDAVDDAGKTTTPKRDSNQKSRNETLKSWCPANEKLDDLIDMPGKEKTRDYTEASFAIRVAYQCPVAITFKGKTVESLANTLEDALVFQNIDLFASHDGKGLIAKFRKAIEESATITKLGETLADNLKGGGKAELALDLLEIAEPKALKPPVYIREGLLWLTSQLRQHQEGLGLPVPKICTEEVRELVE